MKILALDQATKITGYAIFKNNELIEFGSIKAKGLQEMYFEIHKLIKNTNPDLILIEDIFKLANIKVTITLANLQGLIFSVAWQNKIEIEVIHPKTWKSIIGIKSNKRIDQKKESIEVCKQKFGIDVKDDISDAILIGDSYIQTLMIKKDDDL